MDSRKASPGLLSASDFIAYGPESPVDSSCLTRSSSLVFAASSDSISAVANGVPSAKQGRPRAVVQKTVGTPAWYIKKFQENTVSRKQLSDLQGLLQCGEPEWIMQFVELRGMSVLAQRLRQLSRGGSPRQDGFRVEHEIVKCISYILNHKSATKTALSDHPEETIVNIASVLGLPHLPTKSLVLDILVFLVYWNDGSEYALVVSALEALNEDSEEPGGCYSYWFKSLMSILSGRGRMGSPVGATDALKRAGGASGAILTEFLMSNILLINGIVQAIDDLDVRMHHRSLMEASGLQGILELARNMNVSSVDKQLDLLESTLEDDERSLALVTHHGSECDFSNIDDVYTALRTKTDDSPAQKYLLSTLQHLLLLRAEDRSFVQRFQLVDSVVGDLVMDGKLGSAEKRMGLSVERVVEQLNQVNKARTVEDELIRARSDVLQLKAENAALQERAMYADTLLGTLQAEIMRLQERMKASSARTTDSPRLGWFNKENLPLSPQGPKVAPAATRPGFFSSWFAAPQDGDQVPVKVDGAS